MQCGRTWFNSWVRKIPWRREWQPTPVFLPGEFHGQRSMAGYSSWGCKESDTTEQLTLSWNPQKGMLQTVKLEKLLAINFWKYYQVQAWPACCLTGQLTEEWGVGARNATSFRKPANQEDGRLMSQNNHLVRVWMPGSFYRRVEEVKTIILPISPGMANLREEIC